MEASTCDTELIFSHGRVERTKAEPDYPSFLASDKLVEWNNTGGPRHVPGIHVAVNFERLPNIQFSHGFGAWKQERLSTQEIGLLRFMGHITDQKNWQHDVFDFDAVRDWRTTAFSEYISEPVIWEWCIFELLKKAKDYIKTPQYIFALDSASRVCKSDRLKHTSLLDLLKKNTEFRSSSPSLYPFIFAQSPLRADGVAVTLDNFITSIGRGIVPPRPFWDTDGWSGEMQYYSKSSQWLASDIKFTGNGNSVQFVSPINNLHPRRHRLLYTAIERLISESILEWNQVLLYKTLPRNGTRVKPQRRCCNACAGTSSAACSCTIKLNKFSEWATGHVSYGTQSALEKGSWCPKLAMDGKYANSRKLYDNISLSRAFRDRGLQVYVELFNIELDADGSIPTESARRFDWDLNGNRNERIVATTLVCLSQHNIEKDSLKVSFRSETNLKSWEDPGDRGCSSFTPPATPSSPVVGEATTPRFQELVTVALPEGRTITYPNALQHKFQPFDLEDDSEPGYVQLLAVHLADPHYILCSTRHVPQQSVAWWWEASKLDLLCVQHQVPREMRRYIVDFAIGEGSGAPPEVELPYQLRFGRDHAPERPQEERPIRIEAAVRRRARALEEHREVVDAVNSMRIYGVPSDLRQQYRELTQVNVPLDQTDAGEGGYPEVNTVPEDEDDTQGDGGTQVMNIAQPAQATQPAQPIQPIQLGQAVGLQNADGDESSAEEDESEGDEESEELEVEEELENAEALEDDEELEENDEDVEEYTGPTRQLMQELNGSARYAVGHVPIASFADFDDLAATQGG